ncbi:conserved hypothetical protein [Candidatus Desulfarcum epimagneticum]|uniref:Glycosyltransferase 2-like domain-containing protein n=1 Tax=uncultured Desulfobacteraceae bacterium TaxID=218296 RepID=A0A484HG35_9BACT|nr:conserved hypothetical protein [uncultured Desulfobacteraceae bacterium]
MKGRLIVFTRFPEPGRCKTRLIPFLGEKNAAGLHRRMSALAIGAARDFCRKDPDWEIEIRFSGGDAEKMAGLYGPGLFRPQSSGSLGRRMREAMDRALSKGASRAVLFGCDCPGVSADLLARACGLVKKNDLVLGPALDGGYWLIGTGRTQEALFSADMPWGSDRVLEKTLAAARSLGLSPALLPPLADVDLPSDLARIFHSPLMADLPEPVISVIIPTLNEEKRLPAAIKSARAPSTEIIVADGGSADATLDAARNAGAFGVLSPRGRGTQQNAGAARARGRILLFLHADTRLPERFGADVIDMLSRPGASAGAFRLGISGSHPARGMVAFFANLRSAWLQLPYGDQALFVLKDVFEKAGGFPDAPIMEDYELVLKLKKMGRVRLASRAVSTSGRRWDELGFFKTLLINQAMIMGRRLKVGPKTLEKWYRYFKS